MNELSRYIPHLMALVGLLALSGFFSGSETALFSLSRTQVKQMSGGNRFERTAAELLRQPQLLLSSVLVGNMVVNILTASLIANLAGQFFSHRGVGVAIGVSTLLLLFFGEITPKTIAVRNARTFSLVVAVPLRLFSRVVMPLRVLLRLVTNAVLFIIGQRHTPSWGMLTREQMLWTLAAGQAAGVTDERERELVEHILDLNAIDAKDIMVPRTEVFGVSDDHTVSDAYQAACRCRHTRIPVYHEDLDDIWGLISVVDLPRWRDSDVLGVPLADLRASVEENDAEGKDIPVHTVYAVPESAKVEPLLATMREWHTQLVVLVDEYGGTAGILTLDDILEEVVGQISPPDRNAPQNFVVGDGFVLVDGRTHVRELNRELDMELPEDGTDTISGFLMEKLGRVPRGGDTVMHGGHRLQVIKMAGRRVGAVRVESLSHSDTEEEP